MQTIELGNIHFDGASIGSVPQLGATTNIEAGNDAGPGRILNAVWRDDQLYAVNTIVPPIGLDQGQVTAHWYRINTADQSNLTLADQGDVGAEHLGAETLTFYPAIAVDSMNNLGLVFSASGPSIHPGAYFTGRLETDAQGTVRGTSTLAAVKTITSATEEGGTDGGIMAVL